MVPLKYRFRGHHFQYRQGHLGSNLLFARSKIILWYVPLYQWLRLKHLFHPIVEQVSLFLVYPTTIIEENEINVKSTYFCNVFGITSSISV